MLMRARAGVTALEYGLIAALLAGILVSVVTHFATDITALFTLPTPIATSG
jgi:Flp pilus assembly pilin Flp